MSSINQILNSALMESVDEEAAKETAKEAAKEAAKEMKRAEKAGLRDEPSSALKADTPPTKDEGSVETTSFSKPDPSKFGEKASPGFDYKKAGLYGGAGLAALGAGLGAVALAKKLRAKKAAAKKAGVKKA